MTSKGRLAGPSSTPMNSHEAETAGKVWDGGNRAAKTAPSRARKIRRWSRILYPEEILALSLVLVTVAVNLIVHRTFNLQILFSTVNTYRLIFKVHINEFGRALRYFATAYVVWELLRFLTGRPMHLVEWLRLGKLRVALRALPTYFLCGAAFGNLWSFIHRLSPIDRDDWLIAADRFLFLGHDPIKLMEPLVSPWGVRFGLQVYLSLYLVPWFAMMIFLQMGKLRAFRDTLLSWWLAIAIGWMGYVLVPAIGPQYTLRHTYVRPVFDVEPILRRGSEYLDRATFPSLHTGFSVTVLLLVWRYSSNWVFRIAFTIWVSGIVFMTMYLRFHYVVDVIAGIALALLSAHLGPRLNDWWDRAEHAKLTSVGEQQERSAAPAPSPAEG